MAVIENMPPLEVRAECPDLVFYKWKELNVIRTLGRQRIYPLTMSLSERKKLARLAHYHRNKKINLAKGLTAAGKVRKFAKKMVDIKPFEAGIIYGGYLMYFNVSGRFIYDSAKQVDYTDAQIHDDIMGTLGYAASTLFEMCIGKMKNRQIATEVLQIFVELEILEFHKFHKSNNINI